MLEKIIAWLRNIMNRVFGSDAAANSVGVPLAISNDMARAIERWKDEYTGKAEWLRQNPQSLSLPALISAEIATLVTLEAKITVSGSPRADWIMEQLKPVFERLQEQTEYACALGGLVFKPYLDATGQGVAVDYIQADDFYPVAFNSQGEITQAIFVERKRIMQAVYSRVEYHSITPQKYTITNRCFRSYSDVDAGQEVSLTDVPEWAAIKPVAEMEGIPFPLFAYFRIPLGNPIDPKSPLGVSVFAKAEKNIKEADKQYQRLLWEYEGGELAIDANEDAFEIGKDGKPIIPHNKFRLWRVNHFDEKHASQAALFSTFSPALRDSSYIAGLNKVLQKIEDQCMLARGTLSERTDVQTQTATEIKMLRQRTYAMTTSIQTSLEKAINGLVKAIDATATLYGILPPGNVNVSCAWDDSVVTDADTERARDMQEIRDGIMQKWEYRVKWYGESEDKAKAMIANEPSDDEIMGFKTTAQRNNGETGGNQDGKR